jgi:cytochrome P450
MTYDHWTIPARTPLSQSNHFVHHDPSVFPSPCEFLPERWLEDDARQLDRYLCAFAKGSRNCAGINLAWAELRLVMAYVLGRFEMEIHDTTVERDVQLNREVFLGVPSGQSKGIRAKIVGRAK